MSIRSFTRASFLAALVSGAVIAVAPSAQAARNADAESYVQEHASAALRTLGDRSLSTADRRRTFDQLMARFADMPRIANFVLGRYAAQLRSDPALRSEWQGTFEEYSVAVYETHLGAFNGSAIRVTDSIERVPGRDIIVISEVQPRTGGRPLPLQWRLLRSGNVWKVVDVSLILDGNQIWLAQQQQSEFLAVLGRNNGDIRALMGDLRQMTASMRQRVVARG